MSKVNEHLREKQIENILTNKNFPCGLCDLVFENESKLIEHTVEIHTNAEVNKETKIESASAVEKCENSSADTRVFNVTSVITNLYLKMV